MVLRTWMMRRSGGMQNGDDGDGHDRNPASTAEEQRNYLKDWFNSAGAVPWQDGKV